MIDQNTLTTYRQFISTNRTAGHSDDTIKSTLSSLGVTPDVMTVLFAPVAPAPMLPPPSLGLGMGLGIGVAPQDEHRSTPVDASTLKLVSSAIADAPDKRRTILDGEHIVKIDSVTVKDTYYGIKFFVEFEIIESSNPGLRAGQTFSFGRDAGPVTSKTEEAKKARSHRDIREWVTLAVTAKLGRTKYESSDLDWAISASQPCRGLTMRVHTKTVQGKNGPFVVFDWSLN